MQGQFHQPRKDHCLIFIQPSRTAGNAFFAILQEAFGESSSFKIGMSGDVYNTYQDFLVEAKKDAHDFYGGHFCFGIDRHINRQCDYVVSLRHPVERLLSRYAATCRQQDEDMDWGDWLESDFESNNGIIKRLLGIAWQDDENIIFDINRGNEFTGPMDVGEDELEAALDILDTRVSCILFKDHFEESLLRLGNLFAMPPLFSMRRQYINHAQTPTSEDNYPKEVVNEIHKRNKYDILLYDRCLENFESFLDRQNDEFHEEVRIMKILSTVLMDFQSQIMSEDALMGRFFNAVNKMLNAGHMDDAIAVISRFTCSPYINAPFHRGILNLLNGIKAGDALSAEIDKYRKHFGDDPYLDTFKPVLEKP